MPPHDDVVEDRAVLGVEQVGVLGPAWPDLRQVVGERVLEHVVGILAVEAHGPEVRDVEHHDAAAAREMLVDRPGVLERHLPPAERHHLGAGPAVDRIER
jgi:hypothetical protein